MSEEIFGPILPIINIDSAYEAINFINKRDKPLTLYVFTNNSDVEQLMLRNTSSGGACVNDTILHISVHGLPFGGIGSSGMGAYHGKATFDTFTHKKSCLIRNYNKIADTIASNRFPPYNDNKVKLLSTMLRERWMPSTKYLPHIFTFALGIITAYAIQSISQSMGHDD